MTPIKKRSLEQISCWI